MRYLIINIAGARGLQKGEGAGFSILYGVLSWCGVYSVNYHLQHSGGG